MSNQDFFSGFDSCWTIEEIHQDLKESRGGSILVKTTAGRVSATVTVYISAEQIKNLVETIDVVREAGTRLNTNDPIFVGKGCVVRPEESD